MNGTNMVSDLPQLTQNVQSIVTSLTAIGSAVSVIVMIVGRWYKALKTGNSPLGAIIHGTNAPEEKPTAGTLASTITKTP